jgi:hypothetical protein
MQSFLSTIPVGIPSSSLLNMQPLPKRHIFYTLNAVQFIDLIFGLLYSLNAQSAGALSNSLLNQVSSYNFITLKSTRGLRCITSNPNTEILKIKSSIFLCN